jgi:hypothetical protein
MKSIVLSLFFAGCSLASLAGDHTKAGGDKTANTAEVRFTGASEGEFSFNILYNNAAGSRFSVAILDESGDRLYQDVFSDRKFDRKFRIAEPDSFGKVIVVIRNYDDNSVQRFEVRSDNRLVEDVEVKEVN